MPRAYRFFASFLGATVLLAACRGCLAARAGGAPGPEPREVLPFLLTMVLVACCVGTWASAVAIASVHRVTWPLFLCVGMVVTAAGAFVLAAAG